MLPESRFKFTLNAPEHMWYAHVVQLPTMYTHRVITIHCFPSNFVVSVYFPPEQLYFTILPHKVKSTAERHYFCIDDELSYEK